MEYEQDKYIFDFLTEEQGKYFVDLFFNPSSGKKINRENWLVSKIPHKMSSAKFELFNFIVERKLILTQKF